MRDGEQQTLVTLREIAKGGLKIQPIGYGAICLEGYILLSRRPEQKSPFEPWISPAVLSMNFVYI
jgi:hypothetical protein